jgi:dTDP-glucose pyrophosphorylase
MKQLEGITVGTDATIHDAMRAISETGVEIALVVGSGRVLLGTITDGDIRRALLSGATLESAVEPHMKRTFTAVGPEVGRAEVLDIMRARTLRHIPVVDVDGVLRGLHLMRELIGAAPRPNDALILAGGKGTRLHPLTKDTPKPMLKVAGRPILERIVLHLVGCGITHMHIAVHHLSHAIEDHFGDGERFGCSIGYLREKTPLGTAGAISLLPAPPGHPLLVMNGDLVTQADIGGMLDFHASAGNCATVGARVYSHEVPFGVIEAEDGRVARIVEKPTAQWTVNAGIYVIEPAIVPRVPAGLPFTMPELLDLCIQAGDRVGMFLIEDDWIDVGMREELLRARGQI